LRAREPLSTPGAGWTERTLRCCFEGMKEAKSELLLLLMTVSFSPSSSPVLPSVDFEERVGCRGVFGGHEREVGLREVLELFLMRRGRKRKRSEEGAPSRWHRRDGQRKK